MATLKLITFCSHALGPNPWKVALPLEEVALPYESKYLEFTEAKQENFMKLNPNGKLPAIEDPNTDITLFESGAIIEYLIDQYDTDARLHRTSLQEKYLERSWLHLQMSAQGPSVGYKVWLSRLYPEDQVASATEYFTKEINRIIGVIDGHLTRTAFIPMYLVLNIFLSGYDPAGELRTRPSVIKIAADKRLLAQKSRK
ncbi:uncharacterized protein K452DRAFT_324695 [Aplosporella prunicola CBS 121167]|uniref:GST N-terminal domain-containing protein n=1 Tax=Aplosporella prunicola CBS 121167 TaxID=1176127 RepID=A0A6A6BPS5_9PEZI|nr:uncharacterized protein K452DRAFT_324695 [Aplosporella prunicola CBS 121167]KAF2144837.1 hypothetical protein K452DRAFT_324695 [Aplosporella prunicola CBS 121167]